MYRGKVGNENKEFGRPLLPAMASMYEDRPHPQGITKHKSLVMVAKAKTVTARRNTEDQTSGKKGGALEEAPFFPGH